MLTIHFRDGSQCGGFDASKPIASILAACSQRGWKKESIKGYSVGNMQSIPTNIGIEVTRTNAGDRVSSEVHRQGLRDMAWLNEVHRRVKVRWEETHRNESSVYGRVFTNTDEQGWVDEGIYLLSSTTQYVYPDVVEVNL